MDFYYHAHRTVSYPDDSTQECIPLTPPTTPLLTTITASQTQTSTHESNNDTTMSHQENMTVMYSLPTPSPPVGAHSFWPFWPFYAIAGCILVLLIIILSGLAIFGYCWSRKFQKKLPLKRTHSSMIADSQSEVSSHHSLGSRDKHRSTSGNLFYSQTDNTTPNEEAYTATADISCNVNSKSQNNSSVAHQWHSDDLTTSRNEFLKSSPTLSKRSICSQQSEQMCSSGSPQLLNFRQSQNSLLLHAMPGGVYSTRTQSSHPQKLSHHTDKPHTNRGSISSFQGGRNSRASSKQSHSRSSNSWSSNKAEIRFPGPMKNHSNSFQEDCELIQ